MHKIISSLMFFTLPLSAALFHPIDTTCPLRCTFSNMQHNRILIEEGRIKKIICQDDKLMIRVEEISGQVFVQARYPFCEPTLLSIVTQDGLVQDVEILFDDCPPEVVILKHFSPENTIVEICETPSCTVSPMNEIISCIMKWKVPCGYHSLPFRNAISRPKVGMSAKLVSRLQGCVDTLFVYEITNRTCFKRKLLEKQIACPNAQWAYLPKNCLGPREKVLAIVSVNNE